MNNFSEKVSFIWSVADLLRGPYKPNQYGRVILPLTILRRLDCVLEPTKDKVLKKAESLKGGRVGNLDPILNRAAGVPFHNTSRLTFEKLKGDPNQIGRNLTSYIKSFSANVRGIFDRFGFDDQITKLDESDRLFLVVSKFCDIDLHPDAVPNIEMGYIFEDLIRRFNEAANETAGDHFTPREIIRLMVNLLFSPDSDILTRPGIVKTMLDPACGTGGMLAIADEYLRELNPDARLEVQRTILLALEDLDPNKVWKNREAFRKSLYDSLLGCGLKVPEAFWKIMLAALSERDETADVCTDKHGNTEPDADLRDYENVPLSEDIAEYFRREVVPHVPDLPAATPKKGEFCVYVLECADGSFYKGQTDNFPRRLREHENGEVSHTSKHLPVRSIHWEVVDTREAAVVREKYLKSGKGREWLRSQYEKKKLKSFERQAGAWIDESKTKVGYEIPLNRHFYQYRPPRSLEAIEADIAKGEKEIIQDMFAMMSPEHATEIVQMLREVVG